MVDVNANLRVDGADWPAVDGVPATADAAVLAALVAGVPVTVDLSTLATQATLALVQAAVEATLTDTQLRAAPVRVAPADAAEQRYAATLTADDTIACPAGGRLLVRKFGWLAVGDPNTVLLRWADVGGGVLPIWQAVATQQTVMELGEVDRDLEIVLATSDPVDANVHYEELP